MQKKTMAEKTVPGDKVVYFIRHGESEANALGISQTATTPLSKKGKEQAKFLAERFSKLPVNVMLASTYTRAEETAKAIAEHVQAPLELHDFLIERRSPSVVVGKHYADEVAVKVNGEIFSRFGEADWRYSDEETYQEMYERASSVLRHIEKRPEHHIAVVTHGDFLFALISVLLAEYEQDPKLFLYFKRTLAITNTGITLCRYRPNDDTQWEMRRANWRLITWNDHAHLADA
jgi:broad specificity phosphatase PhoE